MANETLYSGYTWPDKPQPSQRQRIAAACSELRRRDKVAHAALKWEISNNLDNLDAVERIVIDALRTLDSNEQAEMQRDLADGRY
jgi:hypothetical protein